MRSALFAPHLLFRGLCLGFDFFLLNFLWDFCWMMVMIVVVFGWFQDMILVILFLKELLIEVWIINLFRLRCLYFMYCREFRLR